MRFAGRVSGRPLWVAVILTCAIGSGQGLTAQQSLSNARLDSLIAAAVSTVGASPGLAVALVDRDEVLYEGTFGSSDVTGGRPVDRDTRFYIASVTKAFLAEAIRLSQGDSSLDVDAPLAELTPSLDLGPAIRTTDVTLRDLLVHRSGLVNSPVNLRTAFLGNAPDLRLLFRAYSDAGSRRFAYTNVGYILAAQVAESVVGSDWRRLIGRQVLEPLRMTSTGFSFSEVPEDELAHAYSVEIQGVRELPVKPDGMMHAAGGMISTLADMELWLRAHMNDGCLDGVQVLPAPIIAEVLSPQITLDGSFAGFRRYAYGLGWYLATYGDLRVIQVFGSYAGYRAHVSFAPDLDRGIIILQNEGRSGVFFPDLIAENIYDLLLGRRWDAGRFQEYLALVERIRGDSDPPDLTRAQVLPAAIDAGEYAGNFRSESYGLLEVAAESTAGGEALSVWIGEHRSYLAATDTRDVFSFALSHGSLSGPTTLLFERDARGGVGAALLVANDTIRFERAP